MAHRKEWNGERLPRWDARARSWHEPRRLVMLLLGTLAVSAMGCCKGEYRGITMDPPVEKVIVCQVEGPYGEEFTDLLVTALAGSCGKHCIVEVDREVSGLKRSNLPADVVASLVREAGGQAFIKGKITRSEGIHDDDYYVMGNFQLYDADKAGIVGGMDNARCTGRRDFGAGKDGPLDPSDAQKVHVCLARYVAQHLARALGH